MDEGNQGDAEATPRRTSLFHRLPGRPRSIFHGWWMVGISFISHLLSGGLYNVGLAVYFLPIGRDLGLSRAALSLAFTLRSLEGGLDAPLTGYLIDRWGSRFMVRLGTALAGLGFILLAFTHSYTAFLLVFLGPLAVGFSSGFGHPMMALTNQWFVRQRARAMTFGFVGTEVGGALLTPLMALVVLYWGWREGAIISGIIVLVLMPPLTFFIRNTPESMGLTPDGEKSQRERPEPVLERGPTPTTTRQEDNEFTVREALATRAFWQYSLAMGTRIFSKSAVQIHLVPLLVWKGLEEQSAALMVGLLSVTQVPLRIVASVLGDRWSMTRVPALASLAGAGALAILLIGGKGNIGIAVLFIFLFALAESANTVSWAITGHFFGRRNFGTLRGGVSLIQSLLSLPAPVLAGLVYDRTSSYTDALIPMVGTYLLAALLYGTLRAPRRPPRPEAATDTAPGG